MGRKNPKRRLMAKLAAFDKAWYEAHKIYARIDNPMMASAPIKSVLGQRDISSQLFAPRSERLNLWEGTSKRGKVVAGKFKPFRGARKRWASEGL